jgi:hypothetical protein
MPKNPMIYWEEGARAAPCDGCRHILEDIPLTQIA